MHVKTTFKTNLIEFPINDAKVPYLIRSLDFPYQSQNELVVRARNLHADTTNNMVDFHHIKPSNIFYNMPIWIYRHVHIGVFFEGAILTIWNSTIRGRCSPGFPRRDQKASMVQKPSDCVGRKGRK